MLSREKVDFAISSNLNYIRSIHGEDIEEYFEEIIVATDNPKYERIAIKACHAVGKTFTMARVIEAIMSRFNNVKTISTAPTFRQVHDLLWKEIHSARGKKPPAFRRGKLNEVDWWINSETFARGFSPQKSAVKESGQGTDSSFQGYHAKYLTLVVFDEATGIPNQIWKQAEGLLTSGDRVLFLAIANPTSRNCDFFKCFQNSSWKTFSITCFDSPNLKENNIKCLSDIERELNLIQSLDDESALDYLASYKKPRPYLISARWVIEKAIEWGVDHPLFKSKVLGEFPDEDSNVLIGQALIRKSQEREIEIKEDDLRYIGVDVARFGEDKTCFTEIIGNIQTRKEVHTKRDTNEVVGLLIQFLESESSRKTRIAIDAGFSHGVIDNLRERKKDRSNKRLYKLLKNIDILEIPFGGSDWVKFFFGSVDERNRKTLESQRKIQEARENYMNYKAIMFDYLSRDIKSSLKLLNDKIYLKQLPSILMLADSRGRLKIESKQDYKERTGESSPDEADSLALANLAKYYAIKPISVTEALSKTNINELFS